MTVHAQTPNHIRRGPASAYLHWSDGTRYRIYSIACAVTTFPRLGPNTQDEPLSEGPCCWTFSHPPLRSHIGRYMGELLFPSVAPAAWGHPLLLAFIATVESCPWSLLPPLVGVADKISGRKKCIWLGHSRDVLLPYVGTGGLPAMGCICSRDYQPIPVATLLNC